MKIPSEEPKQPWSRGKRYVVARIGKAGGKMKYTLLDECDISLVNDHIFEARLEIDKNGNGASIFAYAFCQFNKGSRSSAPARYLHEVIWERHAAVPIAPGFKVIHKNQITMDNRFENLQIVPRNRRRCNIHQIVGGAKRKKFVGEMVDEEKKANSSDSDTSAPKQMEQSLYWSAIQLLPPDHVIDESPVSSNGTTSGRDGDEPRGMCVHEMNGEATTSYYECHFPPCFQIEQNPREFSICGRCREARYCGSGCQQKDWPVHKKFCREKPRRHSPYNTCSVRLHRQASNMVNKQDSASSSSSSSSLSSSSSSSTPSSTSFNSFGGRNRPPAR